MAPLIWLHIFLAGGIGINPGHWRLGGIPAPQHRERHLPLACRKFLSIAALDPLLVPA